MADTEVAIVGMGAVFPRAGDVATFWRNIRDGVDAITEVPPQRWDPDVYYRPGDVGSDRFYCKRGGFVDELATFDPTRFGIMPAAVDGTEPDQLLVLRAAAEAITDSGGPEALPDPGRVGVIIGRGGYLTPGVARLDQRVHTAHQLTAVLGDLVPSLGKERLDSVREAFQDALGPDRSEASIGLVPNFAASRVANRFDFHGPAYTVDAACASSLLAVDHAVRELTTGRCDAVLAGGVHTCHHTTLWSVFTQLRALSPTERIRPFDRAADGTLLSEGTGVVLLKRLSDALTAGDRVYAVIRGVGVASDGRATSMMSPLADGQVLAVERAWRAAGVDPVAPGAVGLVEAHGTATPAGDAVELETLRRVFGVVGDPIGLGTVKSMIGHTMPAAGIAGLIKAALAVHHGVLPPTLHVTEPHPALAGTRFTPVTETRPWDRTRNLPRRAAVNAFGFGGINAHIVLEEPPGTVAPHRTTPERELRTATAHDVEGVLLVAGADADEVANALRADDADLIAGAAGIVGDGPCRLAIVAPDARRLALARKIVARGRPWRGRSDVWFAPRPTLSGPEQVAFLFPGFEPEFAPRIEGVAEHFGLPVPALRGNRDEVVAHALDVIAVSRLFATALDRLDITPGVLAGHSLGEWTAMIVAGVYPAIDEFMASMRPGMVEVPDVIYAAFGASADRVDAVLGEFDGVVVSHDNCPHQSVVCGPADLVEGVVDRLRGQGVLAQALPFRTGFHSPMYTPHLAAARTTLRHLDVRPASVPIWSATSLAPFPGDPDEVRELVLRHLVEPVRFRRLVELLHDSGVRAFVQVGPGSLTGFVEDTLHEREHVAIATSVPQRDGLGQLRRALAALWAEGLSPRFEGLPTKPHAGSNHTAAKRAGAPVRLRLGDPLIRLPALFAGDLVPPVAATSGGGPVLAEFGALLDDANSAAREVIAALNTRPRDEDPSREDRRVERVVDPPPSRRTTTRVFSLETMPDIADHCVFPQPDGWPEQSDRFPVVPMTTLLEVMADAARDLVPDTAVTAFEQVRAFRWLTVAPPTTAKVHAVVDDAGSSRTRVKVQIEGYASGVVRLSHDGCPPAPDPAGAPLRNERPAPVGPGELYRDRWMFHGARFAGVTGIGSVADDGITGTVRSMPARGALLDSAGQLIGHWMQVSRTVDQTVLPTGIESVRLFGPQPPVGTLLPCTAWIREVTETEMRADAELRDGDGRVWCRIGGWTTRRFATDEASWRVKFHPETATLSQPRPGGWSVVWERWPDTASRELMMRSYLNESERARYAELNPLAQRQWLLGRIAVKDAVRRWLWDRGAGPIYPAEITVDNDDAGRPRVRGPFQAPQVSVAHCTPEGGRACAVAAAGDAPLGIDVEPVTARDSGTEHVALTRTERDLLDRLAPAGEGAAVRAAWFARLWTAKEAAGKAVGTGLAGRPQAFEVRQAEAVAGDASELLVTAPDGSAHRLAGDVISDAETTYVVAWTTPTPPEES
jgi:acyl transferase domain-containing protein/phosphopantetheinyl transferase